MIRRILVGLGGTPFARTATQRAVKLASAHGAEVTAVTLMGPAAFDAEGRYGTGMTPEVVEWQWAERAITLGALQECVSAFEDACAAAGVACRVVWESGDAMDLLVEASRYHDLVICGLRGILDYRVMADPRDSLVRLIRHGVRPVLAAEEHHRPVERVLVAYSGSMESARTLRTFVQMKLWPECRLTLATFQKDAARSKKLLQDAAAYCRAHGFDPDLHHGREDPAEGILAVARSWPADLVVVGDSAHGVIARKVLGDTLLHVVREADCPLFLSH